MIKKAYFAAGCFWGVEHLFQKLDAVVGTSVGYTGGAEEDPTYEQICAKATGHAEVLEIEYDSENISYEDLVKHFFEIHDFTQVNGQGPDIGEQYRSEIFYIEDSESEIAEQMIGELGDMGYEVATHVTQFEKFWPAEEYHQDYYSKTGKIPYCHIYKKIW